ncbi:uncharacterized protein LOC130796196 [Actinidia eriantha]|uniref:uncharacterized protein LOC130796196 n=1 Tax=Actinidia eriantha TaxID=165200 RepID=UPI002590959D|nr:uncharacterized protein LOC130796196 [Actinidia eriantha]
MEFKFRAIDGQSPQYIPPSSSMSYFTGQAIRAGYSGLNFGRTGEFFRNPIDVREGIQRELEKERIREEIIAAEIARKSMLEAEVRREMMLETEMALRRADGLSLFAGSSSLFGSRFSRLNQSEGRSLEERLASSLEQKLGYQGRPAMEGFQTMPFQRCSEPKITEIKSPSEVSKEKENEKIIFLAKPEANLSGTKRKAVTPPTAGASELPSVGSKKKSKDEWSCAICQVSATSVHGLNEHLQGKKHKSRESGLRAQRTGKNYAIGLFLKKTKPIKLVELNGNQNLQREVKVEGEVLLHKKSNNDLAMVVIQDTDDSKAKNGDLLQKTQENIDEKKSRFKFWCEMCQVGAFSEKVLNKHRKGKKHMGRLLGLDHSGGSVRAAQVKESPQKKSDPEVVAAEEIEETPDIVGQAVDGEAVENHEAAEEGWLAVPPIDS